jgi:hypothetical protein
VVGALVVALVVGCSADVHAKDVQRDYRPGFDGAAIGLVRSGVDGLTVLLPPCPNLSLISLVIDTSHPDGGVTGAPLWGVAMVDDPTVRIERVVIGTAPVGTTETVEAQSIPVDVPLSVTVLLDQEPLADLVALIATAEVVVEDLPVDGVVAVNGGQELGRMSESEFRRRSLEGDCSELD